MKIEDDEKAPPNRIVVEGAVFPATKEGMKKAKRHMVLNCVLIAFVVVVPVLVLVLIELIEAFTN